MNKWPLLALALLAGCDDEISRALPSPLTLNDEAAGYYCQMVILEHQGPKAQIFLAGALAPLWFSQVRDGLAYLKSPEQEGEIIVLYVNDMGEAVSYSEPGADNWIKAQDAFYVVGSDALGGMGAPELVPFGSAEKAEVFAANHGGIVQKLEDISAETVLSPVELVLAIPET